MSTAVATKQTLTPVRKVQIELRDKIEHRKAQLLQLIPRHIAPDAFWRKINFAVFKNPDLLKCTPESIIAAVTNAAQLGLDPTGLLAEGYLVPFGKECQFIPGYQGLISLARRSGMVVSIRAKAVYKGDVFEVTEGDEPRMIHKPAIDSDYFEEAEHLRFVYAVATLVGESQQWDVMSRKGVDRIRARSRAGNSGPWVTDYVAMALKTVIRRLFKYIPKSAEVQQALEADERADGNESAAAFDLDVMDFDHIRANVPAQESGTSKLKAKLDAAPQPAAESPKEREPGADDEDAAVKAEQAALFEAAEKAKQ